MRITPVKISSKQSAAKLMSSLGVSEEGVKIMSPKSVYYAFKIEGIRSCEANIIKQCLLSLGSDAAVERAALTKDVQTSALIFGSLKQLNTFCQKLNNQPFGLKEVSRKLSLCLSAVLSERLVFWARDKKLNINNPVVCGIINITNDSFSGDGLISNLKGSIEHSALDKAEKMVKNGAKIIDVGGESTRPGSIPINEKEEIRRVIPVLKLLRKRFKKVLLSVDTYKYKVAKSAVDEGVDIINDITGLRGSSKIASLVKKYKLGCILMHMKGNPQNMQIKPNYHDVVEEELDFFKERLQFCAKMGIERKQISIDPGIGFGKRLRDNMKIINELAKFRIFKMPIFLGVSRKSFIGEVLKTGVNDRLLGTVAAEVISFLNGADILRTHDVKETVQALRVASILKNN